MLLFSYLLFSKLTISDCRSSLGLFWPLEGTLCWSSSGALLGLSWGSPGHPWVCGSPVALLVSLVLPRVGCWAGPWLLVLVGPSWASIGPSWASFGPPWASKMGPGATKNQQKMLRKPSWNRALFFDRCLCKFSSQNGGPERQNPLKKHGICCMAAKTRFF